jgi:hypothetical protein
MWTRTVKADAIDRSQDASPYYPPRERWYTPLWYPWHRCQRLFHLEPITDGFHLPAHKLLLGMAVPGLPWLWYGRPLFSLVAAAGYCLSALVFLIWIGHAVGTLALATMMSIHTSGILYMNRQLTPEVELWKRIAWSVAVFAMVSLLVYQPLRRQMERRWIMPLRVGERVLVVNTSTSPRLVKRGDWVAYRIDGLYADRTLVRGGYGVGQVLAQAGDRISFLTNSYSVNQEPRPRQPHMPTNKDVVVSDGHWFIWPNMDITLPGHGEPGVVDDTLAQLAMVPETNFVGAPYRHWWWRRQILP